jgi:hypothetical protein
MHFVIMITLKCYFRIVNDIWYNRHMQYDQHRHNYL